MDGSLLLPTASIAAQYRAAGWWRDQTFLDDLAATARDHGDKPALIAYQGGELARTVSFREFQALVQRFAAALHELGVGRGDVVVIYLPNYWMLLPLYLACNRIGAISSPLIPILAERELRHVLTASAASVCITVDVCDGVDYGARLVEVAPPTLRHRVVLGDSAATGAIDFTGFFVERDDEQGAELDPTLALGADEHAMLLYTSGTSGQMKAVAHSHNTVYSAVRSVTVPYGLGSDDVISVPNYHTHMAGMTYALYMSLCLGTTCVVQDDTDMDLMLDLIARHEISWSYLSPSYLVDLIAAQRRNPRTITSLRRIVSGSAPLQPHLITAVRETFDVPLEALWGMTENGGVTVTRDDDPEGWAAHSDGRAEPWMQVRIEFEDDDAECGRLLVRGASQCLGYLGQREVYQACLDADGWFDTGDLAKDDGRGGIRIFGRRGDLVTRASGMKVPILEIEAILQALPSVKELVLVGYPDPDMPRANLVCAVVVPEDAPPTLEEIHEFLADKGVARILWPDRVQFVWALPKNSIGKVLRQPLRQRLELAASRP